MFTIKGLLRREEIKNYPKKDGTTGTSKTVYIEPEGEINSVAVGVPAEMKVGKEGDVITLSGINVYAFTYENGKRERAQYSVFIPNKN